MMLISILRLVYPFPHALLRENLQLIFHLLPPLEEQSAPVPLPFLTLLFASDVCGEAAVRTRPDARARRRVAAGPVGTGNRNVWSVSYEHD